LVRSNREKIVLRGGLRLSGGFGTAGAAKRAGTWAREGHVPEINFRIDEFETDIHFAVAFATGGNDTRFDGAIGVLVDQEESLAGTDHFVYNQQSTLLVDRTGRAFYAEFFADFVFAVDYNRYGQGDPQGSPTLSIPEMKNSHQYASCSRRTKRETCYACAGKAGFQAGIGLKNLSVPLAEAW